MIVGVAAKVVPTLNGVDGRRLSSLWGPFVLLNLGCGLRVTAQTLTDFTADSFPLAGVSGLLEVSGLALWGFHLWSIMRGTVRPAAAPPTPPAAEGPIEAGHRVGEVLDRYPGLLNTFLSFSFQPLANPVLRRTVARHVSLAQACRVLNVDVRQLLDALNAARNQFGPRRFTLPLLPTAIGPEPFKENDSCQLPTSSPTNIGSSSKC